LYLKKNLFYARSNPFPQKWLEVPLVFAEFNGKTRHVARIEVNGETAYNEWKEED
jgi:hypothetical protein